MSNDKKVYPRIHLSQFAKLKNMSPMQQNGFKAFVDYKEIMKVNQWEEAYARYINKDKKKEV